jgi:hypothetical protein
MPLSPPVIRAFVLLLCIAGAFHLKWEAGRLRGPGRPLGIAFPEPIGGRWGLHKVSQSKRREKRGYERLTLLELGRRSLATVRFHDALHCSFSLGRLIPKYKSILEINFDLQEERECATNSQTTEIYLNAMRLETPPKKLSDFGPCTFATGS